jgi:hypothetical protein
MWEKRGGFYLSSLFDLERLRLSIGQGSGGEKEGGLILYAPMLKKPTCPRSKTKGGRVVKEKILWRHNMMKKEECVR